MYFPKDGWSFTFDLDGVEINGKILNEIIGAKKPDNNAPKNIKGDYDLSIHGNTIVLVDNADGTTVEAKCHPDDEFDICVGVKEAFKKLNEKREELRKQREEEEKKIKVGDWVEVVLPGRGYNSWYDWLPNNRFDLVKRFDYGKFLKKGMIGKVLYISKEKGISPEALVYFEDMEGKCHTIGLEGLKKVKKPNV